MPRFIVHCKECEAELGTEWAVVHRWLDAYASQYYPSQAHRAIRHHKEGVEEVREKWGDQAAEAAELHIKSDFKMEEVPSESEVNIWYNVS